MAPQPMEGVQLTFEAVRADGPSTKTQIGGENMTEVLWSPGDAISIFYGDGNASGGNYRFDSNLEEPASVATFSGSINVITSTLETNPEKAFFQGVYPYDPYNNYVKQDTLYTGLLDKQMAVEGSVPWGRFPSAGRSEGLRIGFYNLLGGIRFTLNHERVTTIVFSGNNGEVLSGGMKIAFGENGLPITTMLPGGGKTITLTAPDGGYFEVGKPYFLPIPPTNFEKGFTIAFSNQFYSGKRVVEGPLEIVRSEFKLMTDADKEVNYELVAEPAALSDSLYTLSQDLYLQFRQMFYIESWPFTNAGTDEFMIGGDGASEAYNTYDSRYSAAMQGLSNTANTALIWNMMYTRINQANTIIEGADFLEGYARKDETLGTAYFIRGYNYLFLVNQYGDIPLELQAYTGSGHRCVRDSREDAYGQIISDLEKAYQMLPDAGGSNGKAGKGAAAHFLAQAHLWRASECNDDWNARYKAQDLKDVIKYADIVIAAHPLTEHYEDLYANYYKKGALTENNSEILLKTSYELGQRTSQYPGSMSLVWFCMPYQSVFSGFMRRDVAGSRSYQRLKNTPRYSYFIYDLEKDSRFWKSFKTTWAINYLPTNESQMTYWAKDGSTINTQTYFGADDTEATFSKYLGGMFIINRKEYGQKFLTEDIEIASYPRNDKRFRLIDYNTGKYIPTVKALLTYGSEFDTEPENTSMNPNKDGQFAMLSKYLDGDVNAYNLNCGFRDQVIARSAEDYFFKAEALIRQGSYDEGIAVLKPLRDRAQFRAGEERDKYMDGGMAFENSSYRSSITSCTNRSVFYPKSSYFYSVGGWDKDQAYRDAVNAEASTLPVVTSANYPPEDQYVMDFLALINSNYVSDPYTRALCYLLNEKSREMYGEFLRYNDLVRTRTLEDRLLFNDQAWTQNPTDILGNTGNRMGAGGDISMYSSPYGGNFDKTKHYLRPIPQSFLDALTKDGKPLSDSEKAALQNPGY